MKPSPYSGLRRLGWRQKRAKAQTIEDDSKTEPSERQFPYRTFPIGAVRLPVKDLHVTPNVK